MAGEVVLTRDEIKAWMVEHTEECTGDIFGVPHVDALELVVYAETALGMETPDGKIPEVLFQVAYQVAREWEEAHEQSPVEAASAR